MHVMKGLPRGTFLKVRLTVVACSLSGRDISDRVVGQTDAVDLTFD